MESNKDLIKAALELIREREPKRAAELLQMSADNNEPEAAYYLGYLYSKGDGVPRNYKKAIKLLTKASNQGYTPASFLLGSMYIEGQGCEKSSEKAAEVWEEGANHNDMRCAYNLAMLYDRGIGVKQSKKKAISLLRFCADNGFEPAVELMKKYTVSTETEKEDINELVKLAEQGDEKALYRLGIHRMRGIRIPKDKNEATQLFTLSAKKGYYLAKIALFNRYCFDEELEKCWSVAEYWLKQIIDEDKKRFAVIHPEIVKGAEHFESALSEKDSLKATALYASAAENGYSGAYIPLGDASESQEDALGYYLKAAQVNDATAYLRLYDIYSDASSPYCDKEKSIAMLEKYERIAMLLKEQKE